MDDEILYPVCPDRNVVSAFQCFLGPDSRGPERFFAEQGLQWAGDAFYIVRAQGRWALAGVVHELHRGIEACSRAVADFNPVLTLGWLLVGCAFSALRHKSLVAVSSAAPRIALATAALTTFCRVRLPRRRRANASAVVLGRWAAHYRLPVLFGARTLGGLPI